MGSLHHITDIADVTVVELLTAYCHTRGLIECRLKPGVRTDNSWFRGSRVDTVALYEQHVNIIS
jgi:hypothetical protein